MKCEHELKAYYERVYASNAWRNVIMKILKNFSPLFFFFPFLFIKKKKKNDFYFLLI
jgi:hypothetical protein